MNRSFPKLLLFCFIQVLVFGLALPVSSQSTETQIILLDKNSQPITGLIDGSTINLKIEIPDPVADETQVDFILSGVEIPIANCQIPTGERSCQSASLSSLGWYWNSDGLPQPQRMVSARLNGQQVKESLYVDVTPRPVVMVHGYNTDYHTWDSYLGPQGYLNKLGLLGYAVGDGQVEGVLNTGSLSDPTARTNSIAVNAAILGEYIANVQAVTGAAQVDLLVHSMGGMISRFYLDRIMTSKNITKLIILGTPMAGSSCASLPAALGVMMPASLEIQPSYMQGVFNQQIVRRQGVPFYALAGTKLQDTVASPCTPVPSDLVVTVDSVKAIPMLVEEIDLLHTELTSTPEVFQQFVTPLLKTPTGQFEVAADPPAGSTASVAMQFTKTYTGHLNPGETGTVTISIDPNVTVANFALYETSRSLEVKVAGANGNEIVLDPVKNGLIRVDDPSTMVYLGYGFKQPKPGKWVVTLLTTPETPPEGADYALSANFIGGASLSTQTSLTVPRLNETVTISADLTVEGAPITLETAEVALRKPDNSIETLSMVIAGNSATLDITPKSSGIYGIEVYVSAQASDDTLIDRGASLSFEVQPANKQIAYTRLLVGSTIVVLLVGIIIFFLVRKRQVL